MFNKILCVSMLDSIEQIRFQLETLSLDIIFIEKTDPKLQTYLKMRSDVVVLLIISPVCDAETLNILRIIQQHAPKPVALFVEKTSEQQLIDAVDAGANAYVVDGFDNNRINSIINLAIARFRRCMTLHEELSETKQKLNERKDIDRAKGILMKSKQLSENEAYQLLRKMAMDKNQRMGQLAQSVITASELFE
jgi:two-component system, response regulator / RNA-binding antiterminator